MEKPIYTLMLITCFSSLHMQSKSHQSNQISSKNKVTRLRFFLQEILAGENATVWEVARSNITAALPSQFGRVFVLDSPTTAGPDPDSPEVGRLQGTVAIADLREMALAMTLNLVLTAGEHEGSTVAILGRNPLGDEVREVSVVGGSGAFMMATGYILITTYFIDPAGVRLVFEYNAVVYHHHVDSDGYSSPR